MMAIGLSILSAALLSLSFSSYNFWFLAWCGFIPLFMALENKSLRQVLYISFFCGVIFWSLTVYWLVHVTLLGLVILILYLAVYFGFFGGIFYSLRFIPVSIALLFLPASWILLEYLRSYLFTGFPWALLGFSQYKNLPIIQIADIAGTGGVGFLIILVNLAFYLALRKKLKLRIALVCAAILLAALIYGYFRLNPGTVSLSNEKSLKISVIQGNIPQHLKWNKQSADFILKRYQELTSQAAIQDKPELIIWPEASVPGLLYQDREEFYQVFSLANQLKINLLVGAVSRIDENYFNSALLISPAGVLSAIYHKLHLVPFGEYIPLKKTFPFLETVAPIGDIQPGREFTIFRQPANFGVLICFEDLFPKLSREFVKRGAKFLVNITNDAWYKKTSAPYQHFAASVFRSVENRIYLARSANTGISGFIDPQGRILGVVQDSLDKEIFVQGYSSQSIDLVSGKRTVYNRYGDFFVFLCLLFNISVVIFFLVKKNEQ